MKKFDRIKTIQLIVLIILTVTALAVILRNGALYALIAEDPGVKIISLLLWAALGVSFIFLMYDFNSYADMRRENTELDNAVYSDALTGVANRYSVDVYLGQFINKPLPQDMGAVTLEIINLGDINSRHGHSGGDIAIQAFSSILQGAADGACFIGRNGGNKFVAIFRDCTEQRLARFLANVKAQTEHRNEEHSDAAIIYCAGAAFDEGSSVSSVTELVALSDKRAWEASGRTW